MFRIVRLGDVNTHPCREVRSWTEQVFVALVISARGGCQDPPSKKKKKVKKRQRKPCELELKLCVELSWTLGGGALQPQN